MGLELVNWVKDGKYRLKTLELLLLKPYLSSELAKKLDISRSSMSRVLKGLYDKNLVLKISGMSRTVTYKINEKGIELLKLVKK